MPARPKPSAVIFVADVANIAAFYRDIATMTTLHDANDHVVLGTDGFELVIHALRGAEPVASGNAISPTVRDDSYVKLCFPVDSIAEARRSAASRGGFIKPPAAEWSARGFRACDGHDPEGNVLQVREADDTAPP